MSSRSGAPYDTRISRAYLARLDDKVVAETARSFINVASASVHDDVELAEMFRDYLRSLEPRQQRESV